MFTNIQHFRLFPLFLTNDKNENFPNINLQPERILTILRQLSHANCVHIWNINPETTPQSLCLVSRPGLQTLSPEMSRTQKSVSPAIELVGRVLREQGLGRHIDQDFIAAATTEMQEAMGMTPTEFEAAAAALLAAETEGAFR